MNINERIQKYTENINILNDKYNTRIDNYIKKELPYREINKAINRIQKNIPN